tara:strand:- start:3246 stop:4913 length:1668 start_codon:yes stop_codon:yes gene_type:complete
MSEKVVYAIELNDKLTPGLKKAIASATGLDRKMGGLSGKSKKASGGIGALAGGFGKLVPAIALATAAMKAFQFASDSVAQARNFETLENAITFASGSAEEGAKNIQFLKDTTKQLGTPLMASIEGFKTLSGSMMGTKLAGQGTRDIFRQVSTASTAMGLGAEDSKGVFLALGQIMGKGKVQAEELRGQIGERIPGAFKIAADAMGVTQAELNKMMETGKLGAEEFLPRFGAQLEKVFKGALPKAIKSSQAKLNRFNNLWLEMKIKIGNVLLPVVNKLMELFSSLFNKLSRYKTLIVDNLITPFKEWAAVSIDLFSDLISGFDNSLTAGELFRAALKGIGIVLRDFLIPIVKLVSKIFLKVFKFIWKVSSTVLNGILKVFKFVFASISALVVGLKTLFFGLGEIMAGAFNLDTAQIKKGASMMASAGKEGAKAYKEAMAKDISMGALGKTITTKIKAFAGVAPGVTKKKSTALGGAPAKFGKFVPGAGSAKGTKQASTSIDGVKSGRPTHINIDIGKLVENLNISSTNLDDMTGKIKDQITAVLMSSVNNVNNIAG